MIEDITFKPFVVADLHLRSQECPPVFGRVSGKYPELYFSASEIKRSVNRVRDIPLKPLGVADLHFKSQEHPPMSERVPDNCPDLSFQVLEIENSVLYETVSIL